LAFCLPLLRKLYLTRPVVVEKLVFPAFCLNEGKHQGSLLPSLTGFEMRHDSGVFFPQRHKRRLIQRVKLACKPEQHLFHICF